MSRKSLAQQIADLDVLAPVDIDPEAIINDSHTQLADVSRAHYANVGRSILRHDNIADPKYDGVKVSRAQLLEDDSLSSESSGEEEEEQYEGVARIRKEKTSPQQSNSEGSDDDEVEKAVSADGSGEVVDITMALQKTRDEDRKKGLAVSRQNGIWDSLLDARIRIQKSISSSNTLPSISRLTRDHPLYEGALNKMLAEAATFLEQLFELQEILFQVEDSVQLPPRKRRKLNTLRSLPHIDLEGYLDEACEDVSQLENIYHARLIKTLSKWSAKIQAVAPSVLLPSNRNAFSRDRQHLKTAVQLVDETLSAHDKLLYRTQQWRGQGQRLGVEVQEGVEPELDVQIFDDTDFYQQLLRDIIDVQNDSRVNGWMAVQKQKKAKKKVDTKASKGRKLRFDVHEKLQNFMAPMYVKGTWHEEQIDELFASLLGKGFEEVIDAQADVVLPGQVENLRQATASSLEGFRVFG